jgi:hypothetical protein
MTLLIQFPEDTLTVPHNRHEGNDAMLQENRAHLSGQAKLCLDLLMKGEEVSSLKMVGYGIIDTRARIFSLRKFGYQITEAKIPGAHGAKMWYCIPDQIETNKTLYNQYEQRN